ncbi:MAG: hypothetical protein KF850_14760 [Labilithrix sp.]|nr:hypothetical protein [Labilithrix sp.]
MRTSGLRAMTARLLVAFMCVMHASIAQAAPFELRWSAPEGCPSQERMLLATRARLGDEDSSAAPELFVRGTVTVEGGIVVLDLRVNDASGEDRGERRVRFDDRACEAIEAPAALVLAMMIGVARARDASAAHEEPPGAPAEPALVEPKSQEPAPVRVPPPRRPPSAEPTREGLPMTAGLSGVASRGGLPNVGFGGALRWTATLWASVMIGVEGSFETTWAVRAANGEATFRRFDAAVLLGAPVVRSPRLEIIPLVHGRGGLLTGEVSGLPVAYDARSVVGAVGAGAIGRVPLGETLRFELFPDVRVPLARDEFQVRTAEELIRVHRPGPVEVRLSIGLAWELR